MKTYFYRGAFFCAQCSRLLKLSGPAAADSFGGASGASRLGLIGPLLGGGGRSHLPRHCSRCGKLLKNPLTRIGIHHVMLCVACGWDSDERLTSWKRFYLDDYEPTRIYNAAGRVAE